MSTLELDDLQELRDRIAALEQAAADTLFPNVLTVAGDNTIGADFNGHVHAAGLDLDAAANFTPPSTDRLRWLRMSDGAMVANLYGNDPQHALRIEANAPTAADQSTATMAAADDQTAYQASIQCQQSARGTTAGVQVAAGGVQRFLIDKGGGSSYLQVGAFALSAFGTVTLTWSGASQSTGVVNVKLPGATGHVDALISPESVDNLLLVPVPFAAPDFAGGVNFQAETKDGHSPPAGTFVTFAFLMCGV